ncbi:MAG: hypothetical protein JW768_15410 [Chitinispirillaceae bacterium]|nr:hypothetical protein [Chitinispirillaceae bacterium]
MHTSPFPAKAVFSLAVVCLVAGSGFCQTATLQNAGFDTYIAASDSFAFWKADKDTSGNNVFDISQETTAPFTAPGALKMAITPGADTITECRISGSITNLPANKIVTITAMVKYENMPTYWNAMFHLQQATCQAPDWNWIDRKWGSIWGNNPGDAADWTSVTMSDTTYDSANVFNLIISLAKSGTIWVDDIAVTYTDIVPVTHKAGHTARQGSIMNNRIIFASAMPYSLEACGINGRVVAKRSGIAPQLDLTRLGLQSGAYLVRVKAGEKSLTGRVMIGQ